MIKLDYLKKQSYLPSSLALDLVLSCQETSIILVPYYTTLYFTLQCFRLGAGRLWVSIGKRQPLDWPGPMNTTTSHAIALRRAKELASIVIEFSGLTYLPSSLALGQVVPRDSNDSSTCTILHYPLFLHSKPFHALLWIKGRKCIY